MNPSQSPRKDHGWSENMWVKMGRAADLATEKIRRGLAKNVWIYTKQEIREWEEGQDGRKSIIKKTSLA